MTRWCTGCSSYVDGVRRGLPGKLLQSGNKDRVDLRRMKPKRKRCSNSSQVIFESKSRFL